jgi:glycosyltransferase involved in cell wall biosynthesis
VTRAHRRRRYAVVQVHSLPDFLVVAALPLRLAGVPVILDLHEAMPEFFRMRFPKASNPLFHRLLLLQERLSIALANAVITVNDALAARLVELGVRPDRVTVLLNSPSLARFDPSIHPPRTFMADGVLRLVYTGALTPTYEVPVVVDAIHRLRVLQPQLAVAFDVYGRGDSEPALRVQVERMGLGDVVRLHGRIPVEAVSAAVAAADVGLAPTRRDPFTDFSLSTKIFEYAAMGKPVVASALPMVERTFPPGSVRGYEPGDAEALATAILELVDDPAAREASVAATLEQVRERSWEHEAEKHWALIERLVGPGT